MKKLYLLQVELGPDTKVLCDDPTLRKSMQVMVTSSWRVWTRGPEPAVTVEPITENTAIGLGLSFPEP